jgi:hypothetical protein
MEEHRLRVFENRILRRMFGPKRNEATGKWRELHNEELRDVYSSTNIIQVMKSRRIRWGGGGGSCSRYGEGRREVNILVGNPDGKRSIVRLKRMWEDTIKMNLREVGWSMDTIWLVIGTGGGLV